MQINKKIDLGRRFVLVLLLGTIFLLTIKFVGSLITPYLHQVDFIDSFETATMHYLNGKDPLSIDGVFNPPWVYPALVPFVITGAENGRDLFAGFNLALVALAGLRIVRFGGSFSRTKVISAFCFMLAPGVFTSLNYGALDIIIVMFIFMPYKWLRWIWVLSKPHLGIGVLLFDSLSGWDISTNNPKAKVLNFRMFQLKYSAIKIGDKYISPDPTLIMTIIIVGAFVTASFFASGHIWPIELLSGPTVRGEALDGIFFDWSFWPFIPGAIFGLILMGIAVWKDIPELGYASGLFFTPYFGFHSTLMWVAPGAYFAARTNKKWGWLIPLGLTILTFSFPAIQSVYQAISL